MRRPPSLMLRLTLFFGVGAAIVFPIFGWVINRSIERHFIEEDSSELQVIARAVEQALSDKRAQDDIKPLRQRFNDILVSHHGASMYVADAKAQTLFASPGTDLSKLAQTGSPRLENKVARWSDTEHSYRVLKQRVQIPDEGAYTVVLAVPIDYHLRFLQGFHRTLWLLILGAISLISLMGWVAVRQGHAPLHDIVARIRRISASGLGTRLSPAAMPAELTDLALSFNEMLQRMEAAFSRLSNFSSDIAHELRTPVTNLMTQTQVALSKARTIEEYREILYSNLEEYERMAQMIGDMLFLAQADEGLPATDRMDVDLAMATQALFEYYEAWADERGVSLERVGEARLKANPAMMRRVLGNLLSNAIRHTPRGETVSVYLGNASDGAVSIVVENPGPPVPAKHLPRLFDRFYRVDPSRQRSGEGAGLGLAIVKSIVEAHGGTIEVASEPKGTRFGISLPAQVDQNHALMP